MHVVAPIVVECLCPYMPARRQHTVQKTCYHCDATLLKKGAYDAAAHSWKSVEIGDVLARVEQRWLLSQGQVYEHEHSRGAQLKCPSCHSKIKTLPPPDAGGAAAAAFWP